jgi:hypothetical protein
MISRMSGSTPAVPLCCTSPTRTRNDKRLVGDVEVVLPLVGLRLPAVRIDGVDPAGGEELSHEPRGPDMGCIICQPDAQGGLARQVEVLRDELQVSGPAAIGRLDIVAGPRAKPG